MLPVRFSGTALSNKVIFTLNTILIVFNDAKKGVIMYISMFNFWYFFWIVVGCGATVGLYFFLKNRSVRCQKTVLFLFLVFGLALHFLKIYIPPYSVDEARMLRDSWFSNICAANIAVFPFLFFSKNDRAQDYMFYLGVISGLIAFVYPQEPIAKLDQLSEQLDIIRFYYHHWQLLAIPLLGVLLGHHRPSYKRVWVAPAGLLALMLFIILNQLFQSELGFVPLHSDSNFLGVGYKNSSYIWGPGSNDALGNFFALFTPEFFKIVPVGQYAGQTKYWPWFWIIVPVFVLVTPLAFLICMIFDGKNFSADVKKLLGSVGQRLKVRRA